MPRTTLQAGRADQERLDTCPAVVAFLHSVPGLAFLHRLVVALHLVSTDVGACGMRLVCLFLRITGLARLVGASYGVQPRVNGRVEEAIVAYRREERAHLAHEMPAKDMTVAQDETFPGGLCLGGIDPVSNSMLLEQAAQARDHDTWPELLAQALAGLNCRVIQSTSEEAPGRLAYGEHPLGAHHAPDVFHGPHARSKAISAPMAAQQRAAAQAAPKAAETRKRVQDPLDTAKGVRAQRSSGPGRPPKATPCREQAAQDVEAARHEPQRLAGQREQVTQSSRAIGHASHLVDWARGVWRNGTLLAGDIQQPIATMRTMAQQAGLSETGLARIAKAERVVPKMPATIAFGSGSVRQQGRQ